MTKSRRTVEIPGLVRIKPGALDRTGIYLRRAGYSRVALLHSEGLPQELTDRMQSSLAGEQVLLLKTESVENNSVECARSFAESLSDEVQCVVGLGGGKALDVAKYVATQRQTTMFTVPASLSNDGFASPQASLTSEGCRQSLPAKMPDGVIVDTGVCLAAPKQLWRSGVGDLVAKLTAVRDWKLAFHHDGTPVDDFAALLSDASVFQFMGRPQHDLEGIRLLATALMLNGIAMAVCGSSRPASGSEHLISHALDATSKRPRLHGLQVGVATYLLSQLHGHGTDAIAKLFETTGFWTAIHDDPFCRAEWKTAIEIAPTIKTDFHTILSEQDQTAALLKIIDTDPHLESVFC